METTHTPIKRSPELTTLSRDHHDGLLFVWKIKQGVIYGVPAKTIGKYCEWYWQNHLQKHMKKEEGALLQILDKTHPLINNMLEDHDAIRIKMEDIISDPGYYSIQRLAQIIYHHIRFEERILFSAIEKVATAEQLDKMSAVFADDDKPGTEWLDEFWTNPNKIKKVA
jgi:hemerythrin-like domain-containing protein